MFVMKNYSPAGKNNHKVIRKNISLFLSIRGILFLMRYSCLLCVI